MLNFKCIVVTKVCHLPVVGTGLATSVPATTSTALIGPQPSSLGTNLLHAGSTKPFQLQKPPLGKKKQFAS